VLVRSALRFVVTLVWSVIALAMAMVMVLVAVISLLLWAAWTVFTLPLERKAEPRA
jgi:hypothetical protein